MRYSGVAMVLHWLIALAIIGMLALGFIMTDAEPGSTQQFKLYQLHKSIGITILALSLFRLVWRLTHRPPPLPADMPLWQRVAARASHAGFYALMLGMPLTGWMVVSASPWNIPTVLFGFIPLPHLPVLSTLPNKAPVEKTLEQVHSAGAWILIGLLVLHVGAALYHHFFRRDDVLWGMLPHRRR